MQAWWSKILAWIQSLRTLLQCASKTVKLFPQGDKATWQCRLVSCKHERWAALQAQRDLRDTQWAVHTSDRLCKTRLWRNSNRQKRLIKEAKMDQVRDLKKFLQTHVLRIPLNWQSLSKAMVVQFRRLNLLSLRSHEECLSFALETP